MPGLDPFYADAYVFGTEVRSHRAFVSERSLFVIGLSVQEVERVAECPAPRRSNYQKMFMYFSDFISCRETYITGIPSLQALFRVYKRNSSPAKSYATLTEAMGFLIFFLLGLEVFTPDSISAISTELRRKPETGFDDWFLGSFFPEVAFPADRVGDTLLLTLADPRESRYVGECEQNCLALVELQGRVRFFETADGYLGLAPKGTITG